MPSARGARAGGFSAFERLQRPGAVAAPRDGAAGGAADAKAPSAVFKRPPPPPPKDLTVEQVRDVLEALRAAVVGQVFQKALDNLRSRDMGALKKRASVAKLLALAWRAPLKEKGFGAHAWSFPQLLTAVREHAAQPGIRSLSEEVERLLRFFPGSLFGSKAGEMKGAASPAAEKGGRGAFSKLAPGGSRSGEAQTKEALHTSVRGRPMSLGEAKDILKALKEVSVERDFQRQLAELGRDGAAGAQRAVAAFVGKAWSQKMTFYDFPVTVEGFRELTGGISRCAYNRHVEMLAHEVEQLLHVPLGSFFGIAPADEQGKAEAAGGASQDLPPGVTRPGEVNVMLRHNDGTELKVPVPYDATFRQVKEATAAILGRDQILKTGRLVRKKGGGSFVAFADSDPIGDVREVMVLGVDLHRDEREREPAPLVREEAFRLSFEDMVPRPSQEYEVTPQGRRLPKLTTEQGMRLLRELYAGFSSPEFQRKLEQFSENLGVGSAAWTRERQKLALSVQTVVLPKYGFHSNYEGVFHMQQVLRGLSAHNVEMMALGAQCEALLQGSQKQANGQAGQQRGKPGDKVQPEPEEPPQPPKTDPEPEPPPPAPKPPPKPTHPPKEVAVVVRHAVNEKDEDVWLKLWSTSTFRQVREALARKLDRAEIVDKGRLVYKAEGGAGVWTDFDDDEELGRERKELHLLGVALPSKEINVYVKHAINMELPDVELTVWTHWRFRDLREALARALGRQDVRERAKFVFRPNGNNAHGAWAAWKDDEQVGDREEFNVLGLEDLEPSQEGLRLQEEQKAKEEEEREEREAAEKQAKAEEERRKREEAERRKREERQGGQRAKEEAERKRQEEAEGKARKEAEIKAQELAERQAKEEAERRAREEAERQAREEAEGLAQEEAERQAREEAERLAQEEAERAAIEEAERAVVAEAERKAEAMAFWKAKEEERKAKGEAEQRATQEAARKAKELAERKARELAERKAKEEAARRAEEEAEQRAREEAEQKAREEAEQQAQEAERRAKEEERKAGEEAERKAREEADRKAREEADRKAKEEAERKAREEAERRARGEEERKAREEVERKGREEAERRDGEEAARKASEEAERQAREELDRKREAERKAREEAERKAKEEAERKSKEEAEKKAKEEAEKKAKEEAERKKREEAERKKEEAERKRKEEADRKAKEEAERKRKPDAERKAKEEAGMRAKLQGAAAKPVAMVKKPPAAVASTAPRPSQKELVASLRPALGNLDPGDGRMWIVVGGEDKGGILVRRGEGLDSKPFPFKLATGSQIEELEIVGNRFHYKRIRGDGPDFGWVNLKLNEKVLLEPQELG